MVSSVSIVSDREIGIVISATERCYVFISTKPSECQLAFYPKRISGLYMEVRQPGRGPDHAPPSSAELTKA
jgi:hypothetical protein